MDLRRYLFEHRITQKQFADSIDYTRNYVNMIVHGLKPGAKAARAIEKATNGLVRFERNDESDNE